MPDKLSLLAHLLDFVRKTTKTILAKPSGFSGIEKVTKTKNDVKT